MDFAQFVRKSHRDVFDAGGQALLQRLGRSLERTGIEKLLEADDEQLDPFSTPGVLQLADDNRAFQQWKEGAMALRRALSKSGLTLPDGSMDLAFTQDEFDGLERAARMCQRSGFPDHNSWTEALKNHVEFWQACVELSLAHGSAVISTADASQPDAEEFSRFTTKRAILSEMRGYRWLAIRRGERLGALAVALEIPSTEIRRQTEARLPLLGLAAQKRGVESILAELVLNDLDAAVRMRMDCRAEQEALDSTRLAYLGLLGTPPLQTEKMLSVYVARPGSEVGIAVLDKKGDILFHVELPTDVDLDKSIRDLVAEHQPTTAIVPVSSGDPARQAIIEQALGDIPFHRVLDAALSEARKSVGLGAMEGIAVILARRALKPGREWGRVNPLSIGLGEYPREQNPERLSKALGEARILSSWDRRRKRSPKKAAAAPATALRPGAPRPGGKRLNPMVKSLRDLRPGMTVEGVITNITRFGAFVNIGLPVEGMIHVSQLSHEFVDDPTQVVRVGQEVQARIIEVVPEKQRVALSLKPVQEVREKGRLEGPPGPGRAPVKSRSAALADLDALFKK